MRLDGFVWLLMYGSPQLYAREFHSSERIHLKNKAREMFYHGYNNYMEHAFPWDELKPLTCEGRRWDRRERGDLDQTLGGFSLTLIDSLDMLAILGDHKEFRRAVKLVIQHVTFDRNVTVSVFESAIRVIGGLLSAHVLASSDYVGLMPPPEYTNELLELAVDLATRLLPAFDTPTGIPMDRINLLHGISKHGPFVTCPAAGSVLVEFSYLSRLSKNPIFEQKARIAVLAMWERRSQLDLLGSSIDVLSGTWTSSHVGIGAGTDSFYEYLLKYHILTGEASWLDIFNSSYTAVEAHTKFNDLHVEVDMHYGNRRIRYPRVSALQAFWPGLQVLAGDVINAVKSHDKLFDLWVKFGAMPELFDLRGGGAVVEWARASPLRPELIESTYHLYQATRNHKYLKVGRKLLHDIEAVSRVPCGYAAVKDIYTLEVEDRMDSYFLSETIKYLYLLFSDDPSVIVPSTYIGKTHTVSNVSAFGTTNCFDGEGYWTRPVKSSEIIFSTEGHILLTAPELYRRNSSHQMAILHQCESSTGFENNQVESLSSRKYSSSGYMPLGLSVRYKNTHVGTILASPAKFGQQIINTKLTLEAFFDLEPVGNGCDTISPSSLLSERISGKMVMVYRGNCTFARKALNLEQAGAAGVVIINTARVPYKKYRTQFYLIWDDRSKIGQNVSIPVLMVLAEDVNRLVQLIKDHELKSLLTVKNHRKHKQSFLEEEDEIVVSLSSWLW
ncbi:unnamed protein product [Albugo candida]|uniref:alpha-1,2-Mannosidase n=1 Tax=Albugo candida TaxID=65357 RepID=A0A024GNQ8_9STRA|nr:unnamed protein product [Albugo candida]|eukprot:CCI48519.1 unnamed protein product [Albugo candida]